MSTKYGLVKKTPFIKFANIRSNGIIAINLKKNDELLWVKLTNGFHNIKLVTKKGKTITFNEKEIRPIGRAARGVKGIKLDSNDYITSTDVFSDKEFDKYLFVISENGVGKKVRLSLFKGQHRGGKGVKIASVDKRTGLIAFVKLIQPEDKTLIITSHYGQVVKIPVNSIPKRSRIAKGVILMRFSKANDKVVSATFV